MQINISNLETKMCSNTFNEESIKAQLERQFGKFDKNAILQVNFREVKNSGMYEVSMKLDANKKSYTSTADETSASKGYAEAKEKLFAQISKERSVNKDKSRPPRCKKSVSKPVEE